MTDTEAAARPTWRLDGPNGSMAPRSAIEVLVDLNEKVTTVPHLFNLFSLCGCIARIKYVTLFNRFFPPAFAYAFQVCVQEPNHRPH